MPQDGVQLRPDSAAAVVDQSDPQQITDLIEQLDRDLAKTQQSASRRR